MVAAKEKKSNSNRLIDKEEIRRMISELHLKQLSLLMEKIEEGYLEPQEQRLIWDMVRTHNIGIETIDDLVDQANEDLEARINKMGSLDNEYTFDQGNE